MGLGHGDRRLLALPVCRLELGGRDVTAGAVQAFAIPPRHPARRGQLDLLGRSPWALTGDELGKRRGLRGRRADQELPAPVRVKHGVNRSGRTLHYYLNYSSDAQTFPYPYGAGTDLLSDTAVAHSQSVTLKPWDLAIIEEK